MKALTTNLSRAYWFFMGAWLGFTVIGDVAARRAALAVALLIFVAWGVALVVEGRKP